MNNMRRGFTMIELIFVIVIIGILAAVAIPKLSATRDDAKISSIIANTRILVSDAKAYYTARGLVDWKTATVTDITDVPLFSDTTCATQETTTVFDGQTLYMCDDTPADVVIVNSDDENLTISNGASTSLIARTVQGDKVFKSLVKTHRLGGLGVKRP